MNKDKRIDLTEETKKEEKPVKENKINDKQKKIIIYLIIITLIIITIGLCFLLKKPEKHEKTTDKATGYIEDLGKDFYKDYYYGQMETIHQKDIKTFLMNFEETGIPVTLNQVIELHFKTKEEIDKELSEYDCDYEETKFTIYPKDPYDNNSYKIEPHVVCKNIK